MRIFLTGISGQMGSHFAELAINLGHEIIGLVRPSSDRGYSRLGNLINSRNVTLVEGDLLDLSSISRLFKDYKPTAVMHYAAQSQVGTSFNQPFNTFQVNTVGSVNLLEAMRNYSAESPGVFLSTSETFGNNYSYLNKLDDGMTVYVQNEKTTFNPVSPYGTSKLAMYWMVKNYQESYKMPVKCAIQFNSEGERRGEYFVTRKITKWIGKHIRGESSEPLYLGSINGIYRDWSHATDSVYAHYLLLLSNSLDSYVVGSGETHSLAEFLELSFSHAGLGNWKSYVEQNAAFVRPNELFCLCSDPSKIMGDLAWSPKVSFSELVKRMVDNDIR